MRLSGHILDTRRYASFFGFYGLFLISQIGDDRGTRVYQINDNSYQVNVVQLCGLLVTNAHAGMPACASHQAVQEAMLLQSYMCAIRSGVSLSLC